MSGSDKEASMTNKLTTIPGPRIFAVAAPVPLLWLMVFASSLPLAFGVIVLIVAALLVGALRIRWSRSTRSMADVIHDVDGETAPIGVHPTSAVSTPRHRGGRR
jgi:RsiW-degrading membrane proteinase PrsW (M82 family)